MTFDDVWYILLVSQKKFNPEELMTILAIAITAYAALSITRRMADIASDKVLEILIHLDDTYPVIRVGIVAAAFIYLVS